MSRASLYQRLWQDERGFIGTGAAIALGIGAATGAGASIYGAKSAARQNRRSTEATERSDVRAGERETAVLDETQRQNKATNARQKAEDDRVEQNRQDTLNRLRVQDARAEQARLDRLGFAKEQWSGYLGAQQPHWRLGANVLGRLSDMAGGNLSAGDGDMRQYLASLPSSGGAPGGAGGDVQAGGAGAARVVPRADLMSTMTSVRDPSLAAIPQTGASRSALPSIEEMRQLARAKPMSRTMSLADLYAATQAQPRL